MQKHQLGNLEVHLLVDVLRFVPIDFEEQRPIADAIAALLQRLPCEEVKA
jgi:hypothetical protein